MSWSYSMMQIFDIVLRVPPLFVMDSILNQTFLHTWIPENVILSTAPFVAWVLFVIMCFFGAVLVFLLPTKEMLDVYSFLLSGVVLWFSYWFNQHYILLETSTNSTPNENPFDIIAANPQRLIVNAAVQIAMAFSYNSFRLDLPVTVAGPIRACVQQFRAATYLCVLQPIMWRILGFPLSYLNRSSLASVVVVATELFVTILVQSKDIFLWVKRSYTDAKTTLRTRGIQIYLERQWFRLHVSTVLRVFWITRVTYQIVTFFVDKWWAAQSDSAIEVFTRENTMELLQAILISGCETVVALLGMTAVVSAVAYYIGIAVAAFVGADPDDDRNMGTTTAILFFILALQMGLTGLDPVKRYVKLGRNLSLLSAAILHFCHGIVDPVLMNRSASHNPSPWNHTRPLLLCAFLIIFPCFFLHYLWMHYSMSTWLLAVSAFNIEVIFKVVISLLLYTILMIDARREVFWESLDDYVYYIKSTGNTVEFLFGVFIFCNGVWIMLFESGGTIRACMMCIHAYFNIFVAAKVGWKVFMNRRTAVKKINSLPLATALQLEAHNDVCAICYQDLLSARITNCNHLFHGVCLRKWLYVQDKCPLCHELIYTPEPDPNVENRNNAEFEQNMNDANLENMVNAMNNRAVQGAGGNHHPAEQNNGFAHPHQD